MADEREKSNIVWKRPARKRMNSEVRRIDPVTGEITIIPRAVFRAEKEKREKPKSGREVFRFFKSKEWHKFRAVVFRDYKNKCSKCKSDGKLYLEYIQHPKKAWDKRFSKGNVYTLCEVCRVIDRKMH